MKKDMLTLLAKDMDRKEFLIYLGVCFLALTGISGFFKNLSNINSKHSANGFGHSSYGK